MVLLNIEIGTSMRKKDPSNFKGRSGDPIRTAGSRFHISIDQKDTLRTPDDHCLALASMLDAQAGPCVYSMLGKEECGRDG